MRRAFFFLLAVWVAVSATAEERFRWKGRVDGVVEILIQGRSVRIHHLEAKPIQEQDYRFSASLPNWDVEVELEKIEGRGRVRLMEQPSARNEYTAVVRIEDDKGGDDDYEFELAWDGAWDEDSAKADIFRWEGRVDIGAEIEIRGDHHEVKDMGGRGTRELRAQFDAPLPETGVPISLKKVDGRGDVELVQAPSASNRYTAIVRIKDDKGGADNYAFELRWRR